MVASYFPLAYLELELLSLVGDLLVHLVVRAGNSKRLCLPAASPDAAGTPGNSLVVGLLLPRNKR